MNLRKVTLRYLGWCPGIDHAAKFFPDRDVPDIFFIGSGLAIVLLVGVYQLSIPPPAWEPRVVYIDGVEYPDEYFDMSFNYSSLRGMQVTLYQPFNRSEIVKGDHQHEELNISRVDELVGILEEFGAPKIVIGYTMWIGNCTWTEAVIKWRGESVNLNEVNQIGMTFGRAEGRYINYGVDRDGQGLRISKRYKTGEGEFSSIWSVRVKLYFPPYQVTVFRRGVSRPPF